jgi:YidC/Oxa1 family membrane protein insertase
MPHDNNRNTIIFVVAAALLLILYQVFVLEPQAKRRQAEQAAQQPAAAAGAKLERAPTVLAPRELSRAEAAAASPRIAIDNGTLSGSLSLRGARIDDLYLDRYREGLDPKSPPVELLRPEGAANAWFVDFGWAGANLSGLPGPDTVWTVAQGSVLKPGSPVTLTHDNGAGLVFSRRIELDDRYMFTVTDTVANRSAAPVTLAPYGSVQRQGVPPTLGRDAVVHEGAIGWLGADLRQIKYPKWAKEGGTETFESTGGWTGITDKYWLAALIPPQNETLDAKYRVVRANGVDIFEANYTGQARVVPAGGQITETARLFAGAKTVPVLRDYQESLKISNFDNAVDWGMFRIITRPLFSFLAYIYGHIGNFGVSILVLTVVVRLAFFPLANKQYESLTKMKKIQPMMEEIRKTHKDDAPKQQQELMELYKREKINPLAGCLPLILQIPVFYALYKVLTVTIEMRHAPFYGWIKDLSARDPTTIWNLFGAIPWDPSAAPLIGGLMDTSLHLGVLPLAYGVTMWLSMAMSPPAGDPIQQKIFQFMPLIFTFIMAQFAVGLLLYWTWSNVLTILQQYVIMRRFGVDNPIDRIIGKFSGKPRPSSGAIG